MGAVHVHVHGLEDGKLNKRVHPWTIQQTGNVDGDGTGVECKQIGVLHQRTTALEELLTDVLGFCFQRTMNFWNSGVRFS